MAEHGPSHGPPGDPAVEATGFRFGWAAALAGIAIGMSIQIVLALLGIAVGFSWWSPESVSSFGTVAGVWTVVSWIVALFIGALVAGRLAGILTRGDGALHGLVIWAGSTLIAAFMLVGGMGFLAGTAFDLLGRTVGATASAAVGGVTQLASTGLSQTGSVDFGSLQEDVQRLLEETGDPALQPDTLAQVGEQAGERVTSDQDNERAAEAIARSLEQTAGEVDRQDLINVIAAETGMDRQEAENVASRVEGLWAEARSAVGAGLNTAQAQAERTAADVGSRAGSAAWWTLLTLALGAAGAMAGGAVTARS